MVMAFSKGVRWWRRCFWWNNCIEESCHGDPGDGDPGDIDPGNNDSGDGNPGDGVAGEVDAGVDYGANGNIERDDNRRSRWQK